MSFFLSQKMQRQNHNKETKILRKKWGSSTKRVIIEAMTEIRSLHKKIKFLQKE